MASHYYKWHYGQVHYQKRGWGDPLLLVHNVYPGASYEEYERNIESLSRHFTVYAMDLLGFGSSDAPRIKYTANTYIEQVFDFLREEIAQPAHVVASGLSCAYVTEVAAWRANLFKKLVYICPRSEPTGLDVPRWFAPIRHFFLSTPPLSSGFYETMAGDYEVAKFLRNCFFHPKNVTRDKVQRLTEIAKQPGSIYPYASLLTGYLDSYILASLPRVEAPILFLWGKQARPTPVEHGVRLIALARRGQLEVVDQAGAWVHDEQSAKVNRLLTEYLQAPTSTAPPNDSASTSAS